MARQRERMRSSIVFDPDLGRTHNEFKDECDVNVIMQNWVKTGVTTHVNRRSPFYGDFNHPGDYLAALNAIKDADAGFMALPAKVRRACEDDPSQFIDKMNSEEGRDELEALGLKLRDDPPTAPEQGGAPAGGGTKKPTEAEPKKGSEGSPPAGAPPHE